MFILRLSKQLARNLTCESGSHFFKLTFPVCKTARTTREFAKCATSMRYYGTDSTTTNVVYRGNLTGMIKATKVFSLSSSMMGFALQPYLLTTAPSLHPAAIACVGVVVFVFTYVTPLVLHLITRKYITELRFDSETETFECNTLTFFMFNKILKFKASDVSVPDVPGLFTTFEAKGRPLFVDVRQFIDVDAYRHLMGYDKPLDLHLGRPDEDNDNNSEKR